MSKRDKKLEKAFRRIEEEKKFGKLKIKIPWYVYLFILLALLASFIFYTPILSLSRILNNYLGSFLLFVFFILLFIIIFSMKKGDSQSLYKNVEIVLAALTIILLFFQAMIMQTQTLIQNQQKEILQQTSQYTEANVSVFLYHYTLGEIDKEENITKIPILRRYGLCEPLANPETLEFYFQNLGKLNTGPLNILLYSDDLSVSFQNIDYFSNLSFGETKYVKFRVKAAPSFCETNRTSINLTLVYNCVYCTPHRFVMPFKVEVPNYTN
jgi:ABC-type transport system involved in multi-copper enzyme maturation permease subunit